MGMPIIIRYGFVRVRHELVTEVEAHAVREVPVKAKTDSEIHVVDGSLSVIVRRHFVRVGRVRLFIELADCVRSGINQVCLLTTIH